MDFRNRSITHTASILEALKYMDAIDKKLLLVMDANIFVGLLSSGDLQRAIIKGCSLDTKITEILRKNVRVARVTDSIESIRKMMFEFRMEFCPVINARGEVEKIYFWEDVYGAAEIKYASKFNLPIVIMAGGLGTRLRPLTHILPKPLIPIKDKTMLEEIFERFGNHGSNQFFISVNYKSELIQFYLDSKNLNFKPELFIEEKPSGTAGSLSLLKGKISQTFFVTNCDIIVEDDYSQILQYHKENKNEITIVAAIKNHPIPYGIVVTGENGRLVEMKEKPDVSFMINTGMYILEPHLLNEIPENTFFHITDLIRQIQNRNGNVGVYPVSEKSWRDIGEWPEYLKLIGV